MTATARKITETLKAGGIATKRVEAYGRQVVVTCWSQDMANRVALLLSRASFIIRGQTHSLDQTKASEGIKPSYVQVWRVFARV